MADLTIKFKGNTIVEMSESGTKTLKTAGKYCEGDITVEYTKGGAPVKQISFTIIQQHDDGEITDRGSFTVNSGTTWEAWIGDGRTVNGGLVLEVRSGQVACRNEPYVLGYEGRDVRSSDAIISGATYTLFAL